MPPDGTAGVVTVAIRPRRGWHGLASATAFRIRGSGDFERRERGKDKALCVGGNRIIDPSSASFADDQPGFAQDLEVVGQQVGCKVEKVLQVAVAAHLALEDGEDLESMWISQGLEQIDPLFKRYCIKSC